jgi:hypothetical protein
MRKRLLLQLLPPLLRPSQTLMRIMAKPLRPILTLSTATHLKTNTPSNNIPQPTRMLNRATLRLILTISRPLCCLPMMREYYQEP